MVADIFTKAVDERTFETMRAVLRNQPIPLGTRALRIVSTIGDYIRN